MKYKKITLYFVIFLIIISTILILIYLKESFESIHSFESKQGFESNYKIEKNVFQSWKTKNLKPEIKAKVDNMKRLNPEYTFHLYDDNDMDEFVATYYPGPIYEAYNRLNIIVAKVDFWRYLVLYKFGGVYLDMDSEILDSLDKDLIRPEDEAILTNEGNPGLLVQWALIFRSGHPILERTIQIVLENIQEGKTDMIETTGPGAFTKAVRQIHEEVYGDGSLDTLLSTENERNKKHDITFQGDGFSYRIYGTDYEGKLLFINDAKDSMYNDTVHWKDEVNKKSFYI